MKTILSIIIIFMSISTSAQLKIDSLTGIYSYQKNCLEKLIVKGNPELENEKHRKFDGYIVKINSIYFVDDYDTIATNCGIAFLFVRNDSIKNKILESNLFVLKKCIYERKSDRYNSRVTKYYTLIDAVYTSTDEVEIIQRTPFSQCIECQSLPPEGKYFWNRNKRNSLTKAEKWIIKERNRICN